MRLDIGMAGTRALKKAEEHVVCPPVIWPSEMLLFARLKITNGDERQEGQLQVYLVCMALDHSFYIPNLVLVDEYQDFRDA